MFRLETDRLVIREWRDEDIAPFASLNADKEVMRYFVEPLTYEQSALMVEKVRYVYDEYGYTFYAVEEKCSGHFVGLTGIAPVFFEVDFVPVIEIGWRMARPFWGKGYAPEAARAVLNYARDELGISEIVSFTAELNKNSMRVMEKIGMVRDYDGDFLHPKVPEGHELQEHVLYRFSLWVKFSFLGFS